MPASSDKPPFGVYEPPPRVTAFAGIALALNLATVAALLLDRCDIATILAILALLFGGVAFAMLMRSGSSDKPGIGTHEEPPA